MNLLENQPSMTISGTKNEKSNDANIWSLCI